LQKAENKILKFPIPKSELRKILQKLRVLFFMPVSFLAAIWKLDFGNLRILTLPIVGIFAILFGLALSFLFAYLLKLPRSEKGPFITWGSFSNIGSIGGFICYIFLGEEGFALVPFYNFVLPDFYFALGFSIVRYYSHKINSSDSMFKQFLRGLTDIFVLVSLAGIFSGLILNFLQVERPSFFRHITTFFVPIGTALMLISIGLEVKIAKVRNYLKECMLISIIKFILVPISTVLVALQLGYDSIAHGLPLKVIIILASMLVAFTAIAPVSFYDLDLHLANSCWIFTTTALIIVIPVLYLLIQFF
jgi:predicted permease